MLFFAPTARKKHVTCFQLRRPRGLYTISVFVPTARTRATYRFWHITRSCAGRQGYARPRGTLIVFFCAECGAHSLFCPRKKNPDSKTSCRGQSQRLCGATPLDAASLPHPLIDCQHSQASYASFTSSATRCLSPRPSGAHIIGFGFCRHHTAADSL